MYTKDLLVCTVVGSRTTYVSVKYLILIDVVCTRE